MWHEYEKPLMRLLQIILGAFALFGVVGTLLQAVHTIHGIILVLGGLGLFIRYVFYGKRGF